MVKGAVPGKTVFTLLSISRWASLRQRIPSASNGRISDRLPRSRPRVVAVDRLKFPSIDLTVEVYRLLVRY